MGFDDFISKQSKFKFAITCIACAALLGMAIFICSRSYMVSWKINQMHPEQNPIEPPEIFNRVVIVANKAIYEAFDWSRPPRKT